MRITVIGDMMCEPLLLKAAKDRYGYHFSSVFLHVRELFQQSDFVIGNLETPLAGEQFGYVDELFSFNAPEEFAIAAKEAGISLVSTANNHCMDRGFDGLLGTIKRLDSIGLAHIGTYDAINQTDSTFYKEINGQMVAVVAYTYGVNYSVHHRTLSQEQELHINLLRPYTESVFLSSERKKTLTRRAFSKAISGFKLENQAAIKKALGMTYNTPRKDDVFHPETAAPYLERFAQDIRRARERADIVLVLPHVGGQFNLEPGVFTEKVFRVAKEAGADAIIASHPHIVQKATTKGGIPCFYSIGNFSMSPNSVYLLHENLPEYGLAVHLYIADKHIKKCSFSILKMIEKKHDILQVWPVDKLYEILDERGRNELVNDVSRIVKTVTEQTVSDRAIQSEYAL